MEYSTWEGVHPGRFAGMKKDERIASYAKAGFEERDPTLLVDVDGYYGGYALRDLEPCFDLREIEAELIRAVGFESDERVIPAGAKLEKEDLDDVVSRLLEAKAAKGSLIDLTPSEFELIRSLVENQGGRARYLDEIAETDYGFFLPPLVRGWSYVFRYDHVWDFVVPDQAMANAQTIEWDKLESVVKDNHSLVCLADTMTSLFGATNMYEFICTMRRIQGERMSTLDEVLFPVYRAARRGACRSRIVKAESGNVAIVHEELLRSFRNDEPFVVLGDGDEQLHDAIGQCLGTRSAVSVHMCNEYDGTFDIERRLVESRSGEALHAYLCSHVPDDEESLKWPLSTLLDIIGLARRTVSLRVLFAALAARGIDPPARHLPELEQLLIELLYELPHWGCELPRDERSMPERIPKCVCMGPAAHSPEHFSKLLWGENEERIYRETTWE